MKGLWETVWRTVRWGFLQAEEGQVAGGTGDAPTQPWKLQGRSAQQRTYSKRESGCRVGVCWVRNMKLFY